MIFTVERKEGLKKKIQTYEGFNAAYVQSLKHPQVLAIVSHEGEIDCWKIDPKNVKHGIEELKRYYRSEWGVDVKVIIFNRDDIASE